MRAASTTKTTAVAELDQRVSGADRLARSPGTGLAAAASSPPARCPAGRPGAAGRAVRRRADDRLAAWHAPDHDVEERTDDQAEQRTAQHQVAHQATLGERAGYRSTSRKRVDLTDMRPPGRFCRKHEVSCDVALPFHCSMVCAQIVPVQVAVPLNFNVPFCTKIAPATSLLLLTVAPPVPVVALLTTMMTVFGRSCTDRPRHKRPTRSGS